MKKLTLEEIKKIEVDILKDIDRVCRKNEIKYSLAFGTLIGAIRHKGFIPWDDDIDIIMTRENYEKFINIYEHEKNVSYSLLTHETNMSYYNQFIKVVDKKTRVIEKNLRKIEEMGVWVDIFPVDNINSRFLNFRLKKINFFQEGLHKSKGDITYSKGNLLKKILKKYIFISHMEFWYYKTLKQVKKENENERNDLSGVLLTDYPVKYLFEKSLFQEYIEVDFENCKFMAIKEYDKKLRKIYGDYMRIPPVEKRTSHSMEAYWKGE